MLTHINISGARVHNLKNIDVKIPLQKITCLAGPSGSGKTSLAIHTLFAESKRRFIVALPNSMKLFTEKPSPVDVDDLSPVLPVFGLSQYNPILSSRSNVADLLGLSDEFQKLFSLLSQEHCPKHHQPLQSLTIKEQIEKRVKLNDEDVLHFVVDQEVYKLKLGQNFFPSRSWNSESKKIVDFNKDDELWEIGRIKAKNLSDVDRFFYQHEKCLFSDFVMLRKKENNYEKIDITLDQKLHCPDCDEKEQISKSDFLFSPQNALGACEHCQGFGANLKYDEKKYFDEDKTISEYAVVLYKLNHFATFQRELLKAFGLKSYPANVALKKLPKPAIELIMKGYGRYPGLEGAFEYLESKKYKPAIKAMMRQFQSEFMCPKCMGSRLNPLTQRFFAKLGNKLVTLPDLLKNSVENLHQLFSEITLSKQPPVSRAVIEKIQRSLKASLNLGLGHLSLTRKAKTLSGGEYQRVLLIKFFSYDGTDSLFILDEPSLGISADQWPNIWQGMVALKEQGNTIIIIEHQNFFHTSSDYLIQIGPGAGKDGGTIVFQGVPDKKISSTKIKVSKKNESKNNFKLAVELTAPEIFNHKYQDIKLYYGALHLIKGETGSGKTSVILKVLANQLYRKVHGEYLYDRDGTFKDLKTKFDFDSVIVADTNLKRYNSRSSVGSFTELSLVMRKYFATLPECKARGLTESHFSVNSPMGQCPTCLGAGVQRVELQYMEDVVLECDDCLGSGLKREYAIISDGRFTVAKAFSEPIHKVFEHVPLTPRFKKVMQTLKDLKLTHLSMGRGMSTLSGGEKQRLNLVAHFLSVPKNSILFFENLSFGLSSEELPALVDYLKSLTTFNNTLVLIDQNECWNKAADFTLYFKHQGTVSNL